MIPAKYESLFWDKVEKTSVCWNWKAAKCSSGYGSFGVNGKIMVAHRVSYLLHKGKIPDGMCVCHVCDNRQCVNPDHLWLGTHQDNAIDRERKGRGGGVGPASEDAPAAKLTKAQAKAIKELLASNSMTQRQIAFQFSIHPATVNDIARNKTWRTA